MTDWIELKDLQAVAEAQRNGWEIDYCYANSAWCLWHGTGWGSDMLFRGRPKQPKKVTMISECWRHIGTGDLIWKTPTAILPKHWQRFPAGDIVGEVEDA